MTRFLPVGLVLSIACGGTTPPPPIPTPEPFRAPPPALLNWAPLEALLDSAVADGASPGAVVGVSIRGDRFVYGTGHLGLGPRFAARPDGSTPYDLASLTKVISLTTALMLAVDEGRIALDSAVARYVPQFTGRGRERVTVRQLLAHVGGLPTGRPLYREARGRATLLRRAATTSLDTVPGTRERYSDLGPIILTTAVENVYGTRLDALVQGRVFEPLGMTSTRYLPPADMRKRTPPTEQDAWRKRLLVGEVHDENASALGGVSGHAGLFGSADDLLLFGEWLLAGFTDAYCAACPTVAPAPPGSLPEFVRRANLVPGSSRALGWDTPAPSSSAGSLLAPTSIGHTGFTGTSIWIDPTRQLVIVLLTNRVHPTRQNQKHIPLRRAVADLVVRTLPAVTP